MNSEFWIVALREHTHATLAEGASRTLCGVGLTRNNVLRWDPPGDEPWCERCYRAMLRHQDRKGA